jgi:TDG/mug DNA glycosylase family protein
MLKGFPPIPSQRSRILILGTGPSVVSSLKQQYYGHERNAFWPIMSEILQGPIETYEQKWDLLLANDIALWDVLAEFERKGSADSAYTTVIPNNLKLFIDGHVMLNRILFNGQKASDFYRRLIGSYPPGIAFHTLASTSPAYTLGFDQKLEIWRQAISESGCEKEK